MTEEVYFEVTKDGQRPFIVASFNSIIKVLGTHLNVDANNAKVPMKTTLAEGRIEISLPSSGQRQILAPGQQAITDRASIKVIQARYISLVTQVRRRREKNRAAYPKSNSPFVLILQCFQISP
ncbi:FecR family protein [Chitinophaga sancti]|uniref:FecR family protein n=1 Tax=Chitinophaga sancti TaxID=1004 RepID=A0A1K1SZY7_9BACT|nr:FecR family protein [Chitinophaga sancti]